MRLSELTITPYERRYRQPVLDLMFQSTRTQSHLDWTDTGQWLDADRNAMRLAWQADQLAGLLGVSAPLHGSSWLRLVAIARFASPKALLPRLWETLCIELRQMAVHLVAVLIIEDWLKDYVPSLGFRYQEDIITLRRSSYDLPEPHSTPISIRPATLQDIDEMMKVDHMAFAAPWKMSHTDLRQACRIAASCTVATQPDGGIVGYQISTLYNHSAHLARLAVSPHAQGSGIGAALLHDLVQRFLRRGVPVITVNTQASNERSLRLYERYGFAPTGYDLPIWIAEL